MDGRALLSGVMVPLVTPMSAPGEPSAAAAYGLLDALARAGARSLMLFGSNGEGPLLPASALTEFAAGVAARWRQLTDGGPVLVNVTAAGTAEALERAAAVRLAEPDAVVVSPPIYYRHRDDEVVAHFAAFAGAGVPVVAYNIPRYSVPMTPAVLDEVLAMPHVAGIKDSSGDLALFGQLIAAARRRDDVGVSQGSESQLVAGLEAGTDGIVPGIANVAPVLCVELYEAFRSGRLAEADAAQETVDRLITLHTIRPGVPAVKAVLDSRGLCPPHVAAPLVPVTPDERAALLDLVAPLDAHLITPR
ncbi:dihydrodipicolinate synthase family protein [Jiangella aurantiaca]|uniref:Dihydrodipicolinate synthase family protein n=1 Tax=Jiangella aurantiaca TaxID=2530373 RepID=A0A4R5A416_9ACTN|nr:dihydrodipicolinate synthase family protein [Jiangella aurantiaca]TDD66601.1 dihydrodipicolinate synthase family protein [Jiangella aurantiaca]